MPVTQMSNIRVNTMRTSLTLKNAPLHPRSKLQLGNSEETITLRSDLTMQLSEHWRSLMVELLDHTIYWDAYINIMLTPLIMRKTKDAKNTQSLWSSYSMRDTLCECNSEWCNFSSILLFILLAVIWWDKGEHGVRSSYNGGNYTRVVIG